MAGKLMANGIYEGSRIILPEHREAFLRYQKENKRGRGSLSWMNRKCSSLKKQSWNLTKNADVLR